jgi:glucose-1-phosphate adenylyltransferase
MRYFLERPFDYYLILSGDQLYRADFRILLHQHIQSGAEITLATKPVARAQASDFGIMQSDSERRVTRFVEKPKDSAILDELKLGPELLNSIGAAPGAELFQASMGSTSSIEMCWWSRSRMICGFRQARHPAGDRAAARKRLYLQRYWEDIGTIARSTKRTSI